MQTSVYITIDTECTEERLIRGRIRPPLGYDMMMWGRFSNQSRPLGIELIMTELERAGVRGSFFVEALCAEVFGTAGLTEVCSALQARGHDVQLHLHPNMRRAEWRLSGGEPLPDNIGEYSLEEQVRLFRDGISLLTECGVPRDAIVGFRAGNYGASNLTWEAMQQAGLVVDSSLNLCYLHLDCGIRRPAYEIELFEAVPGVWELPVSNFRSGQGFRHLEITAISTAEMIYALRQAHRQGISHVTIVAHPAEFFVIDDAARRRGRPNRINIHRLRGLLSFLARHQEEFTVSTVGDLARGLRSGLVAAPTEPAPIPQGSPLLKAVRVGVQAVKRLDNRFGFV